MSAAALRRFEVSGFDFDAYSVVVEATSPTDAIRKASAMYDANGFGYTEQHVAPGIYLTAEPLEAHP